MKKTVLLSQTNHKRYKILAAKQGTTLEALINKVLQQATGGVIYDEGKH